MITLIFFNSFDNVDVYSDTLRDDFLETMMHSANVTEKLFNTAKSKFPSTKLFLNENFVLNSSIHTTVSSRSIDNYIGFGCNHLKMFSTSWVSLSYWRHCYTWSSAGYSLFTLIGIKIAKGLKKSCRIPTGVIRTCKAGDKQYSSLNVYKRQKISTKYYTFFRQGIHYWH